NWSATTCATAPGGSTSRPIRGPGSSPGSARRTGSTTRWRTAPTPARSSTPASTGSCGSLTSTRGGGARPGTVRPPAPRSPARTAFGQTIFYDPSQRRMLIAGGGPLDGWAKGKAGAFRELYAFDPKAEELRRLADAPTALYASHLAYDPRHRRFLTVAVFNKGEQP